MDDSFEFDDDEGGYKAGRAWFVELAFWRPSALTDEEMALFFSDRDGRWSDQTKQAIIRHKAIGLDLNENWALVPKDWCCPACGRSKSKILRVSDRGILLANLHKHHDHLRDYVGNRALELFGDGWIREAHPGAGFLLDSLQELVSSFASEIVCPECNAADGKAKTILKGIIHGEFSFSPREIGEFIQSTPHADHKIDINKMRKTWEGCARSFNERLSLIDNILTMIKSGTLYRERGTPTIRVAQRNFDPHHQLCNEFFRKTARDERSRELSRMKDEFLARSVQKDSHVIVPKPTSKVKCGAGPTDSEYAAYLDPVSPRRWQKTAETWCCPICSRGKREVVRKSGKGKWAGGVRMLIEPVQETEPASVHARMVLFPGFSNKFIMRGMNYTEICSDCADVAPKTKQRRPDIVEVHLGADDLKACILHSQPHASHSVNWEEATSRAESNLSMGPAWEAYWKHRSLAARLAHLFEVTKGIANEHGAMDVIADEIMFEARIDKMDEAIALAKWVLQEESRIRNEEALRDSM